MKLLIVPLLLALAACSNGPRPLPVPDKNAPVWPLNPDREPLTNDLVQPPGRN